MRSSIDDFILETGNADAAFAYPVAAGHLKKGG
jgi:hypothetical protein